MFYTIFYYIFTHVCIYIYQIWFNLKVMFHTFHYGNTNNALSSEIVVFKSFLVHYPHHRIHFMSYKSTHCMHIHKTKIVPENTFSYYMQCNWLFLYFISFLFYFTMLVAKWLSLKNFVLSRNISDVTEFLIINLI